MTMDALLKKLELMLTKKVKALDPVDMKDFMVKVLMKI